jgi:hypothetical protein
MDGTNSPILMGATVSYFAQTDPTDGGVCVPAPEIGGCAPNFPDLALAGLMAAFEPNILTNTFLHVSAGGSFVQPSSSGGPTIAVHGSAKIGQSFGRHLALLAGARLLNIPDLRGFSATLTTYAITLRIR